MHHQAEERRRGAALVATGVVAWSLVGFFTRLIPLDAWTILVWRGIFGGLFIGLFIAWRYRGRTLSLTRAMGWPGVLVTCLSALGMITFIPALKLTSVADVAIVFATCPFITAALAWTWFREPVSAPTLGASALAFAGVVVTVGEAGRGPNALLGDLLALVMTVALAAMTVALRRYRAVPLLPTACLANLLGTVVSLGLAPQAIIGPWNMACLALFGLQMTLGLGFFTVGFRFIPAAETALIGTLETPLAPFWVWLAFGESVPSRTLLGGTMVMTAVLGHALLPGRRPRKTVSAP